MSGGPPRQGPFGGSLGPLRQSNVQHSPNSVVWRAPGPSMFNKSSIVPAKRDLEGEEKEVSLGSSAPRGLMPASQSTSPHMGPKQADTAKPRTALAEEAIADAQPLTSQATAAQPERGTDTVASEAPSPAQQLAQGVNEADMDRSVDGQEDAGVEEEDDEMDLDEADFAQNEARFQAERARVDSTKSNLSTSDFWVTSSLVYLARLMRISQHAHAIIDSLPPKAERSDEVPAPAAANILTPKAEEPEDVVMADSRPIETEIEDREPTPDLKALPYLARGPPTPLSDPDREDTSILPQPVDEDVIREQLKVQQRSKQSKSEALQLEYAEKYRAWKRGVLQMDFEQNHREDLRQKSAEPPQSVTTDVASIPPTPSAAEGRRMHKYSSEYDIELAMQESIKEAEEARAKQEKEAKQAQADLEREAALPEQYDKEEAMRRMFHDTNGLRESGQGIIVFDFEPPQDDFTEEEHKTLLKNYLVHPKIWGKLAKFLPGRTYKDCINHYYATKWNKEYKRRDGRKAATRKGRGGRATRGRAVPTIAATPALADEEGGSVITDSGRPRRAAAPNFGAVSEEPTAPSLTPAKARGASRVNSNGEATSEKPLRKTRVSKEKGAKRAKNQTIAAAPALSPLKGEKEAPEPMPSLLQEELLGRPKIEPGTLAPIMPGIAYRDDSLMQQAALAPNVGGQQRPPSQHARNGASSYWSVTEQADFRELVRHFGTDFNSIANYMGTKTATMVGDRFLLSPMRTSTGRNSPYYCHQNYPGPYMLPSTPFPPPSFLYTSTSVSPSPSTTPFFSFE